MNREEIRMFAEKQAAAEGEAPDSDNWHYAVRMAEVRIETDLEILREMGVYEHYVNKTLPPCPFCEVEKGRE